MRSKSIENSIYETILSHLPTDIALLVRLCVSTGVRVSEALSLRSWQLRQSNRPTIWQSKTGKSRRLYIEMRLYRDLIEQLDLSTTYVWQGHSPDDKPLHRSTVWRHVKRAARRALPDGITPAGISPHSTRKMYAQRKYKITKDIETVREILGHKSKAVTMLYLLDMFEDEKQ